MTLAQEKSIKKIIENAENDPEILGIILVGSVADGTATEKSDIDVFVIVNNNRFNKEMKQKNYFWGTNSDSSEYPAEVEGKIINKEFLERIWTDGNEAVQNTFNTIKVLYSCDDEIEKLLKENKSKFVNNKNEKIRKFYALMKSFRYKASDDLNNIFQIKSCILDTAYFACRLVLIHNDILFSCLKNIEKSLNLCRSKPNNFIKELHVLLEIMSLEQLEIFYNNVEPYFQNYRYDDKIRKGYVIENENFWFFNEKPYREI